MKASLLVFTLVLCLAEIAIADSNGLDFDGHYDLPQACYFVFKTKSLAKAHCPKGTEVVEYYDFWKEAFIGWSCDCTPLLPPMTIDEDMPIPVP